MRWGLDDFRRAFRPRAGRDVAAGDGGRRRVARGARRGRREVHDPGARTRPGACGRSAARRGRRSASGDRSEPRLSLAGSARAHAGALLLRRPDLARDRVRGAARARARHRRRPARGGVLRRSARGRSSSTAPPTASPTATTSRFGEMALAAAVAADRGRRTPRRSRTTAPSWPRTRPPTRSRSASARRGAAPTASSAGGPTAAAAPAATGTSAGAAPLREALDWLRDQIDPFFEARASAHLKDPWAARDAYVAVVLDRSAERLDAFFAAHARGPLDAGARVEARRLLELQRNRLLMYTSCGWFFDEISGHRARADPPVRGDGAPVPATTSAVAGSRTSSSGGSRPRRATWPSCATAARSTGAWSGRPSVNLEPGRRALRDHRPPRGRTRPTRTSTPTGVQRLDEARESRPTAPRSASATCASAPR